MTSRPESARILVVDDDQEERIALSQMVSAMGYVAEMAADGEEALEKLASGHIDVIVTDLMMPRLDGFELLRNLLERGDLTPAVVLTGFGNIDHAVSIVHELRAFWFLEKPAQPAVLAPLLVRAIQHKRLMTEAERLRRQLSDQGFLGDLVGTSKAMRQVFSLVERVAPTSASVLITGESGTGKERIAAAIHQLSPRAAGPFVAINCAAIPESLIESELFGNEKGAFTGAVGCRAGCFELAHQGTLLLDEIAEMPMAMQAKLLRVLEDSKFRRLGGQSEICVDVRVLAATNRPPEDAIEKKRLREDLFYRLNVFHIALPPLRQRIEDIPNLVDALMRNLNQKHDCRVADLHPETLRQLMSHSWPGNVRELRNVLERAVIVAHEGTIFPHHLTPTFRAPVEAPAVPKGSAEKCSITLDAGRRLREVEDAYIRLTLKQTKNNRKQAAQMLGIGLRTLVGRIADFAASEAKAGSADGEPSAGKAAATGQG